MLPISGEYAISGCRSISDYTRFHKFTPAEDEKSGSAQSHLKRDKGIREWDSPRLHLEGRFTRDSIDFITYFVERDEEEAADFPAPFDP